MVAAHSPHTANTSDQILYTYDTIMHGFAVRLTSDEARQISTASGVTGMYEDRMFYLQTTRSPEFMGLKPHYGAWNETNFGDGIIIGFIDTGIWPESASFNDHGLGIVRSSWKGTCVDTDDFNASLCNNKLVGAKAFSSSADAMAGTKRGHIPSPRDKDGHGTHVSSIAAGSRSPMQECTCSHAEQHGAWRPRRGLPCTRRVIAMVVHQRTLPRRSKLQ
ncbi:hypothetical protein PR202_gb21420 [Eleusine coracana subsp. coracana]|uniref:Uncharacterized protein n=1 Tax=Eleusine coracana subsp. coracana TaxID=191504 RepID=A0AAV5FF61_ELECO|nr:hypothetical protein PR202_gb21420 [Eleusine coracana subsp. coracana]